LEETTGIDQVDALSRAFARLLGRTPMRITEALELFSRPYSPWND
jgi:hypothetical protein